MGVTIVLSPAGSANGICYGDGGETFRGYLKGILVMAKYLLGWILGVPVIVLVIIYLLFN